MSLRVNFTVLAAPADVGSALTTKPAIRHDGRKVPIIAIEDAQKDSNHQSILTWPLRHTS
jgi:hypothetical protein